MSARIAIVSPKQPGTNPRMKKAAEALSKQGHDVHVLYAFTAEWADAADRLTFQNARWSSQRIGGHPVAEPWTYFKTRIQRKWAATVGHETGALMPNTNSYIKALKDFQPDLVIGHNPGALPILHQWKRATGGKVLFDAEDFHRAESYWSRVDKGHVMETLENQVLPILEGMSAASPLIAEAYRSLYPSQHTVTVNNAFPQSLLQHEPMQCVGPLKLVWFSQVLGLDRGLGDFLRGMALTPNVPIQLTLIGLSTPEKVDTILKGIQSEDHSVHFEEPKPEPELLRMLAEQEIGLALEKPEPRNRDICRTNKLYTYPLAGCYMLASHTAAQLHFLEEWPQTGQAIQLDKPHSIADALDHAFHHREELLAKRKETWLLAQSRLNWETECKPLLDLVNQTLKS